ncbi:hypothetical protein Tsubulata_017788 [Turnera subulata]|uniref:(S)-hydroxynitrile lyase n=1 Tax=Turnera subulata TaxID=218843 RepID=A0A9Q0J580_9ROSI|nr:hypothetical protein Tsubulata_017788 [Turnera subulata]
MGEVDAAFIQNPEHRPKLEIIKAEGIPLIDLSILNSPDTNYSSDPHALEGLVKEVGDACKKWGFFQIINHGVSLEKRQKIENASRKFFALSTEEKRKVRKKEGGSLGYSDTEHTKNVRDWKEVFDFTLQNPILIPASYEPDDKEIRKWYNQWPEHPSELREACQEYAKEVENLAFKLMELIALSLGLPGNRFQPFFKDQTTFIRLNHYPPCPSPRLALGVGRHKDAVALTILAQDDVGGLQVKRKSDGEWSWVEPNPDAYIINVGDIIQVWSNDAYESVDHRVKVNSERERFTIPFFFIPAHYTNVKPLEELTNEQNPAKYRPYNWGKFLATRKRSNFKKLDVENIQIYHFRIPDSELAEKLEQGLSIKWNLWALFVSLTKVGKLGFRQVLEAELDARNVLQNIQSPTIALPQAQSLPTKHFVLIHGSCHGAWSFYKIVALLKSSGHNVTAIDLAGSGIDLQQAKSLQSISQYHQPLMDFMAGLPPNKKVILVGHSLGGLAISQAMEKFPDKVSVAVFATALMPGPALNISALYQESLRTIDSMLDSRYAYDDGPNNPPTTLIFGPIFLASKVYQLSPTEDWALATMLLRPLRLFNVDDLLKVLVLTTENYGRVNRVFVMTERDELSKKDFQEWMIKNNPPQEVNEISGSDHMVMMSKPEEFRAHLLSIARRYS